MFRRGMSGTLLRGVFAAVLLLLAAAACQGFSAGSPYVPDRVLVKFCPGTPASEIARAHAAAGSAAVGEIPAINVQVVRLPHGLGVGTAIGRYLHNPNVEYAEPDYYAEAQTTTPSDPYYRYAQTQLQSLGSGLAWDITRGRSDVMIAVLDTGLAYTHPDVQGRYLLGPDFVNSDDDPWDDNGHGTGVYGVVGAWTNNGMGIASVSWYSPVLVVKVGSNQGPATHAAMAQGLTYAADAGARAANLSFAGYSYSQTLQNAVDYAWARGTIAVCAAGNAGTSTPMYPAACNHAVAVSAVTADNVLASYSSYGSHIDLCAPWYAYSLAVDGGYGNWGGTSIAAPYVTGAVGLVASVRPALSAQQIVDILQQTGDDLGSPGWDQYYGWGRVNLYQAVLVAQNNPGGDTQAPVVSIVAPAGGACVGGTVPVNVTATDDVGVTQVDLYQDGVFLGSDSAAPYTWSWNTLLSAEGEHLLVAVASDAAGNVSQSTPVSVTVDNAPPTTEIVSPVDGQVVAEVVPVEAAASDQVAVSHVEFYLDGQKRHSVSSAPYVWNWDTASVANGWHSLVARALDRAGNACDSTPTEVLVENVWSPVEQTEVFSGRFGQSGGTVSRWVSTHADGAVTATLSWTGKATLALYVYDLNGRLLASDTSAANPKSIALSLAAGDYRFAISATRGKATYTLTVTYF